MVVTGGGAEVGGLRQELGQHFGLVDQDGQVLGANEDLVLLVAQGYQGHEIAAAVAIQAGGSVGIQIRIPFLEIEMAIGSARACDRLSGPRCGAAVGWGSDCVNLTQAGIDQSAL